MIIALFSAPHDVIPQRVCQLHRLGHGHAGAGIDYDKLSKEQFVTLIEILKAVQAHEKPN